MLIELVSCRDEHMLSDPLGGSGGVFLVLINQTINQFASLQIMHPLHLLIHNPSLEEKHETRPEYEPHGLLKANSVFLLLQLRPSLSAENTKVRSNNSIMK